MAAVTQLTGGTFKYTSPSNYNTGKDGAEATVHFVVADGAAVDDAVSIANLARSEAIRLVTGKDAYKADDDFRRGMQAQRDAAAVPPTPAPPAAQPPVGAAVSGVIVASKPSGDTLIGAGPTVLAATPSTAVIGQQEPSGGAVVSPLFGGGSSAMLTSSEPTSVLGQTAAPAADTSAPDASTPSPSSDEISDEDMKKAVENKIKELAATAPSQEVAALAPVRLQKLLGEFIALPAKVYQLDQTQRGAYLEKLKTLTLQ